MVWQRALREALSHKEMGAADPTQGLPPGNEGTQQHHLPPHPPAPLDVSACTSSALTPPRLKLTANIPLQKVLPCERSPVSVELLCACSISTAGDEVPPPRGWGYHMHLLPTCCIWCHVTLIFDVTEVLKK